MRRYDSILREADRLKLPGIPTTRTYFLVALILPLMLATTAVAAVTRITIHLDRPENVKAATWPVTVGVPFKVGDCDDTARLRVVDEDGREIPAQIVKTGDWPDGSLRWVLVDFSADLSRRYALEILDAPQPVPDLPDDIRIAQRGDGIIRLATPVAEYSFTRTGGCFKTLRLDMDGNGAFDAGETLVTDGTNAFYAIDSQGRTGYLRTEEARTVLAGPRRTAICISGNYVTDDGTKIAAGTVYFHFFAGSPNVRISHKFILTENTNDLWFVEQGFRIRPEIPNGAASFNVDHDDPLKYIATAIPEAAGQKLVMAQIDFPHFGSMTSKAVFLGVPDPMEMAACGDWTDVSDETWGLAIQTPAFAEQYPKAFRVAEAGAELTLALWAAEGFPMDFRTAEIVKNYIGHDWLPEDDKLMQLANTAHGTAKTHDIWLYPHAGKLTDDRVDGFAATRHEVFAYADPKWVARTEIFGPLSPRDTDRFPEVERAISDYFDRAVLAQERVFPKTGYILYGCYPFGAQPWKQKADQDNRWYPTIHRLSHAMDYNMRRSVWQLWARSGERKYYDYARIYTRFMHDIQFSNTDTPIKPLGWFVQGNWHSPLLWGHFGEGRKPADYRPGPYNGTCTLTSASAADMVQFVYDYFLTGDLHSRDMAYHWKNAMIEEMNFDVPKALGVFRPDGFIRMLSAAYEIDHDPRVRDYGERIIRAIVPEKGPEILRPRSETGARINYGKAGEIFSAFYYYYVATRDPLAKEAIARLAPFYYRRANFWWLRRGSPLFQAYALALNVTGRDTYGAYLAQELDTVGHAWKTLADEGIRLDDLSQQTTTPFGHQSLVGQAPITVGLPVAMQAVATYTGPTPAVPMAMKLHPTQKTWLLLKRETAEAADLEVYVTNWRYADYAPCLRDLDGKVMPLQVLERESKFVTEPECYDQNSIWVQSYGEHLFLRLRVPADVPPGVYELDLGEEVNYTLLYSDIGKVLQAAPDGLVLLRDRRYYFPLPPDARSVDLFTYRSAIVYDPEGHAVETEDLGNGVCRFDATGKRGIWSIESPNDTFERLVSLETEEGKRSYPLIVALGSPDKLFEVPTDRFKPIDERMPDLGTVDPKQPFTSVSTSLAFGKALRVSNSHAMLPIRDRQLPGEEQDVPLPPQEQGTVEFWMSPLWSATSAHLRATKDSTDRLQIYADPTLSITYSISPDNAGRVPRYNVIRFHASIRGVGSYPVHVILQKGKWYHVAVAWKIDGKDNAISVFVNGRKKAFYYYKPRYEKGATLPDIPPDALAVNIGMGATYGYGGRHTGLFDELRLSRTLRYTKDFNVPTQPFAWDNDTYLLMHFDGDLKAQLDGREIEAKIKQGRY